MLELCTVARRDTRDRRSQAWISGDCGGAAAITATPPADARPDRASIGPPENVLSLPGRACTHTNR
jgi:hypothetical protein